MKSTPRYTLIEYNTDRGLISAVVETVVPDTIVYGFTDHNSCLSFLRSNSQKRYLQNNVILNIPELPGHNRHDKEMDAWYREFCQEIDGYVTSKEIKVLHTVHVTEIDYCTVTDTKDLYCGRKGDKIVFSTEEYSSWSGSLSHHSTESPKDKTQIIELIREHRDAIVKELTLAKYCLP